MSRPKSPALLLATDGKRMDLLMSKAGPAVSDQPLEAAAREWVLRLAAGDMSDADLAELAKWRTATRAHARAFEEARRSWRTLRGTDVAFKRAEQQTSRARPVQPLWKRASFGLAGTLAAVAALFVVTSGNPAVWLNADHLSRTGEIREVSLPDGTLAVLNTSSALKLSYTERERRVTLLRGEAWFKVHHDSAHPFIVQAQGGNVRAVGTAFSVRTDDDDDRVTVIVTE